MGPWILGAAVAGGAAQAWSAHQANKVNVELAQKQADYQERMSSSAWQRQAVDMKAAGINPLYGLGHSAASTPQGARAEVKPELKHAFDIATLAQAYNSAKLTAANEEYIGVKTQQVQQRIRRDEAIANVMDSVNQFVDNWRSGSHSAKQGFWDLLGSVGSARQAAFDKDLHTMFSR